MKEIMISNNLIISAGLIIVNYEKKILLIKPNGLDKGQFSLPKGRINENEKLKEAAIRETKEEIGIDIDINEIGRQYVINYFNNGVLTKRCFCYLVKIKKERKFLFKLQKEEVDSCTFYSREEAKKIIFWRFRELLNSNEIWN